VKKEGKKQDAVYIYFLVADEPLYLTVRSVSNIGAGVGVGVGSSSHVVAIHSYALRRIFTSIIVWGRDLMILIWTCPAKQWYKFVKLQANKLQLRTSKHSPEVLQIGAVGLFDKEKYEKERYDIKARKDAKRAAKVYPSHK